MSRWLRRCAFMAVLLPGVLLGWIQFRSAHRALFISSARDETYRELRCQDGEWRLATLSNWPSKFERLSWHYVEPVSTTGARFSRRIDDDTYWTASPAVTTLHWPVTQTGGSAYLFHVLPPRFGSRYEMPSTPTDTTIVRAGPADPTRLLAAPAPPPPASFSPQTLSTAAPIVTHSTGSFSLNTSEGPALAAPSANPLSLQRTPSPPSNESSSWTSRGQLMSSGGGSSAGRIVPGAAFKSAGFMSVSPNYVRHTYEQRSIPAWIVTAAALLPSAVLVAIAIVQLIRRRQRSARGCCAGCGYDLRGNPSSPVCPECGLARMTSKMHVAAAA